MDEVLESHRDQTKPSKTRILVADDHPLMCLALRKIFEVHPDFEVVAEAKDGEEAARLALDIVPDLVVMDISMPKINGLDATRLIKEKCPDILILVLTVHSDIEHITGILEAGADGYLTKNVLGEEVINSIRGLLSREAVLSPEIFKQLLKHAMRHPIKPFPINVKEKLSVREHDVIALAAKGMSNKEIAQQLNLSPKTVKTYLVVIFAKLEVRNRTEAVIAALRLGFIEIDGLD